MKKTSTLKQTVTSVIAALLIPISLSAQQNISKPNEFKPPCRQGVWWADSDSTFSDFDFWVGEWQVFDRESGLMMGFDKVEKIFRGCAVRQHWRQMNDRFSLPGASWRLEGGSHSFIGADGRWHQTWLDNNGSALPMAGGLTDDGEMVLESEWLAFNNRQGQPLRLKYRMHWKPRPDGTIHNWGYQMAGHLQNPEWVKYFDIVYRKNATGGPNAKLEVSE